VYTFSLARTPKILKGKKTSEIRRDFVQLQTLIVNVSRMDQAIDKRKTALSTTIHSTLDEKRGELWSTNKGVYASNVHPPKMNAARAVLSNAIAFASWRS